jgi:SAM-dependent methyltransferase
LNERDNREAYSNGETYDAQVNATGIEFYTSLAQETGGPVLELACGTGRVSIPIARLGMDVTGLDFAPAMLEQARRKSGALPVRWAQADARSFDLGRLFRLIFLTGNSFQQFLSNADQQAMLQCAHAHLDGEGLFAFETRNPLLPSPSTRSHLEGLIERARLRGDFFTLLETRQTEWFWQTYADVHGHEITERISQEYDPITQTLRLTNRGRWSDGTHEQSRTGHETLRYTFPQELRALLHYNGFTVVREFGDWYGGSLTADSLSIILACKKRSS